MLQCVTVFMGRNASNIKNCSLPETTNKGLVVTDKQTCSCITRTDWTLYRSRDWTSYK